MMRYLIAVLLMYFTLLLKSQNDHALRQVVYSAENIPFISIRSQTVPEFSTSSKSGNPDPIGIVHDTIIDLFKYGFCKSHTYGTQPQRLGIHFEGTSYMIAFFREFYLPEGCSLKIYSHSRGRYEKVYTFGDNPDGGFYSLPPLQGDSLILEMHCREETSEEPRLVLNGLAMIPPSRALLFGGSGACEVNVNCPEGLLWQDQKKSVVRILVRNGFSVYWCTGILVNNTRQDKTPYVLTANHCGKGASKANLAQWQFTFNYEAPDCPSPILEPFQAMLTGAGKIAASDLPGGGLGSDFYLLRLKNDVPASFGSYFSGWTAINETSSSGTGIHHPQGDIKKISTYTSALASASWENIPNTHWRVIWASTPSGHGVTEGGSSGSPLFHTNGLLMGTLTGGQASCDSTGLTQPDYYGKFSFHWDQNGLADTLRLKPFLDPDNTGILTMNGSLMGTETMHISGSWDLYPNPALFSVILRHESLSSKNVVFEVYDINGRICLQQRSEFNTHTEFALHSLKPGFYWIRIQDEPQFRPLKLIRL